MLPRHARCAIATLVLLLAVSALASTHGPSEREGRRGLVFGVDGDRLLAFDGAMVAVRQQIGERTGLRLGLTFSLSGIDEESTSDSQSTVTSADTSYTQTIANEGTGDDDEVALEPDLLLIRHGRSDHAIRFFYGAGPVFGYRHEEMSEASVEEREVEGRTSSRSFVSTTWSYGLRGLVGAEWFLTDSISVHAEYRAGVTYRTRDVERVTLQVREPLDDQLPHRRDEISTTSESDGWTVASHGARVGVSLFF
jgi:opacity protein-like surface antigen